MDPSIMKLLEEDEDESMHSGADVDAFQAALNRDIGGDVSTSQPPDSDSALFPGKDGNNTLSQPMAQWKNPSQDENTNFHSQQGLESAQLQEQDSKQMELKQHGSLAENQQQQNASAVSEELNRQPLQQKQSQDDRRQGQAEEKTANLLSQTTGIQISEKNPVPTPEGLQGQVGEPQHPKIQRMSNQQAIGSEQASNLMNRGKQVPFALLLPALVPHLDKDRAMQLRTLYSKLKKNEIVKDVFVRHMRDIVGDQMLRLAVNKMQSQMGASQFQSQASARQQQLRMPSVSAAATQFGDTHSFPQINLKGVNSAADPTHVPTASVHVQAGSSYPIKENNAQKSQELEHQSGSHGIHASQISSSTPNTVNQERVRSSIPVQGLSKQQQQHLHFPQTSFSMYGSGSGSYHPYSGANVNPPGSSLKPHPHDSQMRQVAHHQSLGSTPSGGASQATNIMTPPKLERQNSMNDPGKVQGGSISHFTNNSAFQQSSVPWQALANKEQSSGHLSMTYVKPEPIDQVTTQPNKLHSSTPQGMSAAQVEPGSTVPGTLKDEAFEKQPPRMGFSASTSIVPSNSVSLSTTQLVPNVPLNSRMSSVTSPAGVMARTPPKKPTVGQKKPLEPPGSSPPMPSKKQKVSGAFSDQSIEQLNDVTAVSGVNLREEEEQLFAGPKEDSRVSEASRRAVQEEEERLILQRTPLQKKMAEIMAKCGLKNMSNDVERCLSLCVEERLRGLLCKLIRLSKQRVDAEKTRHRTIITSDVRQQIMVMNRKAREEWEKKQAEAEKLRKINEPEPEGDSGADGDNEKDDGRVKSVKGLPANKEDDDKMRTTAANVAARAAVGGDDMLSKWQLMAEQARQKREGGPDVVSGSQAGNANRKPLSTSGRNMKHSQDAEKRSQTATDSGRKFGRSQAMVPPTKVACAISVKDVIAVLEREPQVSKSTLIYRLYEKVRSDAALP